MNKHKKTLIDLLEVFLEDAYSTLHHDPNQVFKKDDKGNGVFVWEDDLFLIEINFIGIEHIVELHTIYFKGNHQYQPVWSLSLRATTLLPNEFATIQDFRKSINHMHKYNGDTMPIKGPKSVAVGKFKYDHVFVQDWKHFINRSETILINEKKAFESQYHGGLMMLPESLERIWNEHVIRYEGIHQLPDDHEDLFQGYTYIPFLFSWPG